MASLPVSTTISRGGSSLDLGLAAFAAAAVGFAAFAMPAALFAGLVEASGLPGLVAAAAPPLGTTARLAVVAVSAILTFGVVWLFLRALGRKPAERPVRAIEDEIVIPEVPRLRRFDAHPDAPARRPIFAGRDLGEPVPEDAGDDIPAVAEPEMMAEQAPLELDEPLIEPEVAAVEVDEPPLIAAPVAIEAPVDGDEKISNLMQRLEGGLQRRQRRQALGGEAETPPEAPRDAPGHRLRSALNDLQKMAGRG